MVDVDLVEDDLLFDKTEYKADQRVGRTCSMASLLNTTGLAQEFSISNLDQ